MFFSKKESSQLDKPNMFIPLKKKRRQKNAPSFNIESYAYQLSDGVDLLEIDGISFHFVLTFLSEIEYLKLPSFSIKNHFTLRKVFYYNKHLQRQQSSLFIHFQNRSRFPFIPRLKHTLIPAIGEAIELY